jgi:hypothetical protein
MNGRLKRTFCLTLAWHRGYRLSLFSDERFLTQISGNSSKILILKRKTKASEG